MERRMTIVAGLRPLALFGLPADFFVPPRDPAAPEPLRLEWPRRGPGPRLHGDAGLQAAFRTALADYEAAEAAAACARRCGDIRGFFQHMTETHRCYAALEGFELPPADLLRLQAQSRRRAAEAGRRECQAA
jgi:hypothetical protein